MGDKLNHFSEYVTANLDKLPGGKEENVGEGEGHAGRGNSTCKGDL